MKRKLLVGFGPYIADKLNITVNNNFPGPLDEYLVTGTCNGTDGIVVSGNANVVSGNIGSGNRFSGIIIGCPSVVFSNYNILLVGPGCATAVNVTF